jgi:hypothetical protein
MKKIIMNQDDTDIVVKGNDLVEKYLELADSFAIDNEVVGIYGANGELILTRGRDESRRNKASTGDDEADAARNVRFAENPAK